MPPVDNPVEQEFDPRAYLLGTEGSNPLAKWPEDKKLIVQTSDRYDVGTRSTIKDWYEAPSRYRVLAMLDNQVTQVYPSSVFRMPNGDFRLRQDRRDGTKAERVVHPDEIVIAVHGPARAWTKPDISAVDVLPARRVREAFEQPGPDMPGDEEKPQEEPFDPREYFLADNFKGASRLKWLERRMNDRRDNDYYIIPYTSKGTYSDFDEQANYEYFDRTYSWLNYKSEVIGFHRYDIEHAREPEDRQDFETYLANIDDDEWEQFKGEVKEVRNGQCLDDDRSNELRMEAETEYFKDNYHDFIDALREQPWMHRDEYQWLLQAVGELDEDDVAKLCFKHDFYPESEGQGSVYLDFEKAAKKVDPDEVIEVLKGYEGWEQGAEQAKWQTTKSNVWNEQRSTGYLFDKEMREQLADQPELLARYQNMDPRESRAFFDRVLNDAAEHPKGNEYPRWTFVKAGYYDSPKIDRWVVMYPMDSGDWARMSSDQKNDHIAGSMSEFVQNYVIPALAGNAHRIPKEHPELPFTSGIRVGHSLPGDMGNMPNPPPLPGQQESVEEEPFDAREYLTAEPMEVKEWLRVKGFKEVANGAWQWENEWHSLFVMEHGYLGAIAWTIDDYDHVTGQTQRYRIVVHDHDSTVNFLRLLRKRMEQPEPVVEAVPAEPVPPAPEPEFDPREYFTEPRDTGKLVKETPTLRIIRPTPETVERYIETNRSGVSNTRVIQMTPMYLVIPKSDPIHRFLMGIWEDGTLYTPPFPAAFADKALHDKDYSKDLRRFFRAHAARYLKDGEEHMAMRMLAQLYGSKAVLKYIDKYDVSDDLKLKLGIDAAKRGDIKAAAKLLNHKPELLTPETCSWVMSDWSDLSQFFSRPYQKSAESILSGDSIEASWIYDNMPEVKEVLRHVTPGNYKLIRELLPHRTIQPYEDQGPVMLTTPLLQDFSDDDIAYWLENPEEVDPDGELDDIRTALKHAACDAWERVVQDDWFTGYKDTALDAIDASAEWKNGKLILTVPWKKIEGWLDEAGEQATDVDDLLYNHSPRAEPNDDYSTSSWDEVGDMEELIDNQLSQLEPPDYPYDPNQLTMPDVLGPNPNEYLDVSSYSQHSPHGYKTKMKRKDVERWQREEPWRLDPEKWAAHAKEIGFEIPPKETPSAPSVGESLAAALLEKEYKYATTQLDVPAPQSDFIFEWGRLNIPDEKLSFADPNTNPRETEQHVTVLYGLTVSEVPEELRQITEAFKPFPVYIGKVSLFRQETQDVVKLDVESPWLRKLSAEIRAAIPNENKYPDYKPHITIAYVNKGSCDDLEGMDIFANGQETGVDPQFIAYGVVFKGAGDDQGNRVHDTLLFSRVKKTRPVESEPFNGVPFPLDPEHVGQFLKTTRSRAQRTIL